MSKIGKRSIIVPAGVEVTLNDHHVKVKGTKGELEYTFPSEITVTQEEGILLVRRNGDSPQERSFHGLVRALINNMIIGVSEGFQKRLEIIGVGYRAQVSGKKITLNLGYSHPINYTLADGVVAEMDKEQKNVLIISGFDRQAVGQAASDIRGYRPPEPYKGKGIRYSDEYVPRKAGKAAGAKE